MEIERKFLFDWNKVPKEGINKSVVYNQGYVSVNPEFRIRSKYTITKTEDDVIVSDTTYKLCSKSEGGLTREEIEFDITYEQFISFMKIGKFAECDMIHKHYIEIPIRKHILTVGIVDEGQESQFCYGEIEFDSEEEANNFEPLEWFGKDVTNDSYYKMQNYWKRTRLNK